MLITETDLRPKRVNQWAKEITFSLENNCFKTSAVFSFENESLEGLSNVTDTLLRETLKKSAQKSIEQNREAFESLLNGEIDLLPFSSIERKLDYNILIPIRGIKLEDIGYFDNTLTIEQLYIGTALIFLNEPLEKTSQGYVLGKGCSIKDKSLLLFLNNVLLKEQKRIETAKRTERSIPFSRVFLG